MATQQERDLFLRGWRAAMEEVLVVLQGEARAWAEEEQEASQSGEYKLPGSFALSEVRGSFKGRHELLAWITQIGPSAGRHSEAEVARALDALVENRATDEDRALLGLARIGQDGLGTADQVSDGA
jgi:hypothetical protein